ncbi:basic salivary proline-rich protein 3-like [Saccopteryx bilineata]|uniref:basic salivary proline-rich protein 3-like n=1 Tax=Saccopteryx bilineata TaxID=59482 RepID=UPI00338E38F7
MTPIIVRVLLYERSQVFRLLLFPALLPEPTRQGVAQSPHAHRQPHPARFCPAGRRLSRAAPARRTPRPRSGPQAPRPQDRVPGAGLAQELPVRGGGRDPAAGPRGFPEGRPSRSRRGSRSFPWALGSARCWAGRRRLSRRPGPHSRRSAHTHSPRRRALPRALRPAHEAPGAPPRLPSGRLRAGRAAPGSEAHIRARGLAPGSPAGAVGAEPGRGGRAGAGSDGWSRARPGAEDPRPASGGRDAAPPPPPPRPAPSKVREGSRARRGEWRHLGARLGAGGVCPLRPARGLPRNGPDRVRAPPVRRAVGRGRRRRGALRALPLPPQREASCAPRRTGFPARGTQSSRPEGSAQGAGNCQPGVRCKELGRKKLEDRDREAETPPPSSPNREDCLQGSWCSRCCTRGAASVSRWQWPIPQIVADVLNISVEIS